MEYTKEVTEEKQSWTWDGK